VPVDTTGVGTEIVETPTVAFAVAPDPPPLVMLTVGNAV
jgi:hypothetical protein